MSVREFDRPAQAIDKVELLDEPAWPNARDGDAAAAIGVAVRAMRDPRCGRRRRALALAALESCAAAGDPAAQLVLTFLEGRPQP